MERVWRRLKGGLIHCQWYRTRADAEPAITKYIKIFWNRQRRHSRLGYLSPALFAEKISRWQLAA
jgi:transposase InsO family protein